MDFEGYLICLILTVAIELAAYRFVLKRREQYLDICLINVITNPPANALFLLLLALPPLSNRYVAMAVVETLVIISEWGMLKYVKIRNPFFVSVVLNMSSFLGGNVILSFF